MFGILLVGRDRLRQARATVRAALEERLAQMVPARRLRLVTVDAVLTDHGRGRPIRLLDAGCGDGLLSLALAERHPDWTILGVDVREDLLAAARSRAEARSLKNVRFATGDVTEPLPESGFDVVLAIECLSEIPDDERALAMMTAALAPDGLLVAHAPDSEWVPVLPGSAAIWREQVRQGYSSEEMREALTGAGLIVIEIRPTYRSLAAAAQEIRDRIKGAGLPVRALAYPLLAAAVQLERIGVTWGPANAKLALARRADGI
jgi:trans-aconitate methyltransferase